MFPDFLELVFICFGTQYQKYDFTAQKHALLNNNLSKRINSTTKCSHFYYDGCTNTGYCFVRTHPVFFILPHPSVDALILGILTNEGSLLSNMAASQWGPLWGAGMLLPCSNNKLCFVFLSRMKIWKTRSIYPMMNASSYSIVVMYQLFEFK